MEGPLKPLINALSFLAASAALLGLTQTRSLSEIESDVSSSMRDALRANEAFDICIIFLNPYLEATEE